ncbi:MAG TPA: hypothetical protein PKH77_04945 [Anaerolineae bacterium]|nr:hypothetical protein [Anaerolineae bacterium]
MLNIAILTKGDLVALRAQLRAACLTRDILAVMLDEVRQELAEVRALTDQLAAELECASAPQDCLQEEYDAEENCG